MRNEDYVFKIGDEVEIIYGGIRWTSFTAMAKKLKATKYESDINYNGDIRGKIGIITAMNDEIELTYGVPICLLDCGDVEFLIAPSHKSFQLIREGISYPKFTIRFQEEERV